MAREHDWLDARWDAGGWVRRRACRHCGAVKTERAGTAGFTANGVWQKHLHVQTVTYSLPVDAGGGESSGPPACLRPHERRAAA